MSQIEIHHLRGAVAIADELSFSRAASRLKITQPALTKQIQVLESILGTILFLRSNQRVEITDPGKIFVENARTSLLSLDRAVFLTRAAAKGAESVLNFGSSPYVDPFLIATMLSLRLPLFSTFHVHAYSNLSPQLTMQVMTGELDIALVAAGVPNRQLNSLEVSNQPLYTLFGRDEPAAKKQAVSLADFDDRVWVLFGRHVHPVLYEEILSQSFLLGIRPRDIQHVTSAEEAARFVTQDRGIAFLTRTGAWRVAHHGLTMRPMTDQELRVRTTLITRGDNNSRLLSDFVRSAMKKLKSNGIARQRELPLTG
ncbi:LysR family transcriptional regulator [Acidisarcina polymorpha]|nr:LysR family transcriptional regulator [Acidisarcina polymorpha]